MVTAGLAIYDTMQYIKPDVSTLCLGQAASMGAMLLAAGAKGKRYTLPNVRILIHQPMGGFQGQATDIDIHAREILKLREKLNEILAAHSGQPIETIQEDTERDFFMSGEEAREYGLVDKVITKRDILKPAEIKTFLDEYVIGQEMAKKILSSTPGSIWRMWNYRKAT